MSSASEPRPVSLSRPQALEVLRYWLASLQLEEALATRPRARRPANGPATLRLDAPSPGHDYFKLPLDGALQSLLEKQIVLQRPLDAELGAFFETWLASQYRRADDDRELSHLISFPVVLLPRGELAGLLRYGVRLRFAGPGGAQFKVPTRTDRRRGSYPSPPVEARLSAIERTARQWPFFVDTRLLQQQLGVARESIDAFFDELRGLSELDETRMLEMLCELLERELGPQPSAANGAAAPAQAVGADGSLLERLSSAVLRLVARQGGRARAFPVAIVIDGTRAKTTWYLQRELQQLIEENRETAWDLDGCLGAYVSGRAPPIGRSPQRALFSGPALSESQRYAAERSCGSRLTAVQGPPGTGKTTLILHLAAQALVRQVERLIDHAEMGSAPFVVVSTNNRAVDNVIDPLNDSQPDLPLALRAGNRNVCGQVLAHQLQRAHEWLERARARPAAERAGALLDARERFEAVRTQLQARLAAHAELCELDTQRNALQHELERLRAQLQLVASDVTLEPQVVERLYEPLQKVHGRLQQLVELCEAPAGLAQLNAVDRHYRRSAKRDLPALATALRLAGLDVELGLPPPLPPTTRPNVLMEAWGDAAQTALGRVEALTQRLVSILGDARVRRRLRSLEVDLAALAPEATPRSAPENSDALQRELFLAAVAVREAWAASEGDALSPAIARALASCRGEASLRALWSDDADDWELLRQLFGIWGCTLLSLGNCFPPRSGTLDQIVIDEAGQCHPAYAISALLRSRSALIIGDVHQLEPVIDLEPADDDRVVQSCKLTLEPALLEPYRVHSESRASVQALADRAVAERPRLIDHFRCQPEIIAICDALCQYGLQVHTPRQGPRVALPFLTEPVSLIDVSGEQQRLGGSWHNPAELELTLELLQALLAAGVEPQEAAIITPYRGQLELLQKELVRMGVPIDRSIEVLELDQAPRGVERGLTLGTVHRFQGGERSIVIFSSVVTRRASLPFLDQRPNLLNVAVSRARHRFVAIGDGSILAKGERTSLVTRAAAPLAPDAFRLQLRLA